MEITKEQLIEHLSVSIQELKDQPAIAQKLGCDDGYIQRIQIELKVAEIALSALTAEPVAIVSDDDISEISWTEYGMQRDDLNEGAPLYATPRLE